MTNRPEIIGERQFIDRARVGVVVQQWPKREGEGFENPQVQLSQRGKDGYKNITFPLGELENVLNILKAIKAK